MPEERREGYTHLIRSDDDPERSPRKGVRDPGHDPFPHRTLAKTSTAEHEKKILRRLKDGEPRTFNRITVEIYDKTADVACTTPVNTAIWNLVERGQVAHTMVAPILFRRVEPEFGQMELGRAF